MSYDVLVTRRIPDAGIEILRQNGCHVEMNAMDRALTTNELAEQIKDMDAALTIVTDVIDKRVFDLASNIKVVANYGVGFNNIDLELATQHGVVITNTPDVLSEAVADFAWALMFAVSRKIVASDQFVRAGRYKTWDPLIFMGGEFTGRTLGIIGAGRIGEATAMRALGFKMDVLYHGTSRNVRLEVELGARRVGLDELLRQSDYVSIHLALNPETKGLIGSREISLMKKNAYLINTARGRIVDESALVEALKSHRIAGAALDVYENEPHLEPGLAELDNVILTPHIGSSTVETRSKMSVMAAENIVAVLSGETPPNLVNTDVKTINNSARVH